MSNGRSKSIYNFFGLDHSNWDQLLFAKYLIIRPTLKFKLVIVWLYFITATCLIFSFANLAISTESLSKTRRLLIGDIFIPMGMDGVKALFLSSGMGSTEILSLHTAWLYWQMKGQTPGHHPKLIGYLPTGSSEFAFEQTRKFALLQVSSAMPFFILNGILLMHSSESAVETLLIIANIIYWLKIVSIHFVLYPVFAGHWLYQMKLWQRKLDSLYNSLRRFELAMCSLKDDTASRLMKQIVSLMSLIT